MCKPAINLSFFYLCRWRTLLCVFYYLTEIFLLAISARNVLTSRIACRTRCIEPVLIAFLWRHDAVCCHKYRTVKFFKFVLLLPPRISIISDKIFILFKCRIRACRKHLRMCIYINPSPLSLFKKHL